MSESHLSIGSSTQLFLHAVDCKLEIQISSSTLLELSKVGNDWNLLSTASGICFGLVGAAAGDGWLAIIQNPLLPIPPTTTSGRGPVLGGSKSHVL